MNGILGVNATDFGLSRDNLRAAYRKIGGAQLLVRNSPELAIRALEDGVPYVVYRETDDDPQHNPIQQSARAFVQKRASKVPANAFIHLTNELDPSPALNAWTLEALAMCDELGRKAVIFNYATHKSQAQYAASEPVIRRAIAGGHAMGVHVYESEIDSFDEGAYQWVDLYRQIGGLWLITEFAWIESIFVAERGFRVGLADEAHERFLKLRAARFAALRTPVAHFSYDQWPDTADGALNGFGWRDRPVVMEMLEAQNEVYTMTQAPTDERTAITTVALRLRPTPGTSQAALTSIPLGATITVWQQPIVSDEDPGSSLEWVNAQWGERKGWIIRTWNGAVTYEVQATEPPPIDPDEPPIFSVWLTVDEMRQDLALELEAAQLHKAEGQIAAQLEANARKRAALLQKAIDRAE